jgi:hypothetical protein
VRGAVGVHLGVQPRHDGGGDRAGAGTRSTTCRRGCRRWGPACCSGRCRPSWQLPLYWTARFRTTTASARWCSGARRSRCCPRSVLFTGVYNNTQHAIASALLLHLVGNVAGEARDVKSQSSPSPAMTTAAKAAGICQWLAAGRGRRPVATSRPRIVRCRLRGTPRRFAAQLNDAGPARGSLTRMLLVESRSPRAVRARHRGGQARVAPRR